METRERRHGEIRTRPEAPFREAKQAVDLSQAEIIVSVGRGIKEQKNIEIAKALADALGGEIAASRPICDAGWLPMERQVGSSGQTVSPKLYLALGISGAIQHLVGMKGSRNIIAINKDAEAPIFEIADVAVVGNLFDIVPALTEESEESKRYRVQSFHHGFKVSKLTPTENQRGARRFSRTNTSGTLLVWLEGVRLVAVEVYRATELVSEVANNLD